MFEPCRKYLIDTLKDSGIHMEPITSMKRLQLYGNSHVGAVLFEDETLRRNGSKRNYVDQGGASRKRRRLFDRDLTFQVVIGEYDPIRLDEIYQEFLKRLGHGLYVDGNFIAAEPSDVDWVEEADSILKAKIALKVAVTFYGGIYKDSDRLNLGSKTLHIRADKVNQREEQTDG
ncbi:SON protein [Hungatella effluvii]|uniref:SON protein n=1 Tax=Hungatella effluvii TaxID=1096246 RepID=UPI0022E3935F|nr:SON protein [Hungatella effluvii]